jgi:alkylation response protein AidB-like acyl-CoA dehydrogenase
MFGSGAGFAAILHRNGTPEQQRFAELAIERQWGGTMVLTEPDAGSDVGAAGRPPTCRRTAPGTSAA